MTPLASPLLVNVVTLLKAPEPVSLKYPTTNRKRQFCDATSFRVGTTFDLLYFLLYFTISVSTLAVITLHSTVAYYCSIMLFATF